MKKKPGLIIFSALVSLLLLFLNGCDGLFIYPSQAATVTYRGPLKVALQEDLYAKSLERDLITSFAKDYSIKLSFVSFKNLEQAESLLNSDKADLVFARMGLKKSDFRGHFSIAYDDLKLSVVCSSQMDQAKELYLPERFFYVSQSKSFLKTFDHLKWAKTLLSAQKLKSKAIDSAGLCYLSDHRLALQDTSMHPDLQVVWTSKESESVSWITRHELTELNQLFHAWFKGLVRQNKIRRFWDRYEAVAFKMTALENRRFKKDVQKKLPRWKKLFEKAAQKNDIPWTLIAAVAYQESKWDESARSYTGVRGLMQITESTAKHLGITDRRDPLQSIEGGAYYLKYLYNKTPNNIPSYERWAQALAAYNIGWAHIRDAKNLAKKRGLDFTRWTHMKKILPLLSDEDHSKDLEFGSARGDETVEFVDQVFGYTELLNNSFTRQLQTSQDF